MKILKFVLFGFLLIMVVGSIGSLFTEPAKESKPIENVEVEPYTEKAVEEKIELEEKEAEPTKSNESGLTLAQQNAVKQAENYINTMSFSKTGLIGQLEFEGYAKSDAEFAVESIKVDWNEQAVNKAREYLDMMSFSRSGLIEQLKFEGFTDEQVEYGVTQNGY